MWYSPIDLHLEHVQVTNHMHDVQHPAKMSAVAIPLHFILGPDHIDASKYCVITNWRKVRINNGHCVLPRLDAFLYDNYDPECLSCHHVASSLWKGVLGNLNCTKSSMVNLQ